MTAPAAPALPARTTPAAQTISAKPVVLQVPDRGDDLQVRVSAPSHGSDLPVIVLAHGFGLAMNSYDPLVDFWAANGFVVVQPTFLDSLTLGLTPADPRHAGIWRSRVADLGHVIDELDTVLGAVPGLAGRVDTGRLAAAGHSWGGQSVGMVLGAQVIGEPGADAADPRVKAGVLLSTTGTGGQDLTPFAQEHLPFMSPDFARLSTPTLVVAGDHDQSPLTTRGPDWFTDAFTLSPGSQSLVTLHGGEHYLGGIHAYNAADTTDESPDRVDLVRRATTAFHKQTLGTDPTAWDDLTAQADTETAGRIDSK